MFPSSLFISGLLCFGVTADHPMQPDASARIEHVVVLGLDGFIKRRPQQSVHAQLGCSAIARCSFGRRAVG